MTEGRYRLIGSTASPYAIKLRALMRYRRIPFDWVIMTKALRAATAHLKPMLIPVLQYPDGSYRGETTTLAYDLEARHTALYRHILSGHPQIRVPDILPEVSSRRLLSMTWLEGRPLLAYKTESFGLVYGESPR